MKSKPDKSKADKATESKIKIFFIAALFILTAPSVLLSQTKHESPDSFRRATVTAGLGNSMGWYGAQTELYPGGATEGKGGGEFYTPKCVVNLIAEMIEPFGGKINDPCCGSVGMFIQSVRFVESL